MVLPVRSHRQMQMNSIARGSAAAARASGSAGIGLGATRSLVGACVSASRLATPTRRAFTTTPTPHSGSNRWSKVKHKKFATDAAKSNTFSRLTTELVSAIRAGGAVPENNARLAVLLKKAKALSFPKDRLDATIAKATKSGDDKSQVVTYEVMGPALGGAGGGGQSVALIVECETDSPGHNRAKIKETLARKAFETRLSSVSHMFERRGVIRLTAPTDADAAKTLDGAFEVAIDAGAQDVDECEPESESETEAVGAEGTVLEIRCSPTDIHAISNALTQHGYVLHEAEQRMLPVGAPLRLRDPEQADGECEIDGDTAGWVDVETLAKLEKLREALEDNADCQRIWSNISGWPA